MKEQLLTEFLIWCDDQATELSIHQLVKKYLEINPTFIVVDENQLAVDKENLEKWIAVIKELKQFKADAETDIGWVITTFHNLVSKQSPMKLVSKLVMGKVELKEIGIDPDRLKTIGQKYAPVTTQKLLEEK